MPIAVVTMWVCCGRRGKEAKKEAADFLGSFPPHYVSSVAEKMTEGEAPFGALGSCRHNTHVRHGELC